MTAVPMPRLFGDIVSEVMILADAIGDHRSPLDARWHDNLHLSRTIAYKRRASWYSWAKIMKKQSKHLQLREIDKKAVWTLVDAWRTQGKKRGTGRAMTEGAAVNNLVYLRTLLAYARLDTDRIVPSNMKVLRYMGLTQRKFFDGRDKSLEGNDIDFWSVFEKAWALEPVVAVVFLLCWRFGFRLEEAYKWRPYIDFVDGSLCGTVLVNRGGKNGKKRKFTKKLGLIDCMAIKLAKKFASRGTGGLIPDHFTQESVFRNLVYDVAKKCGLAKAQLGVTIHGLRHSFAQRYYLECLITLGDKAYLDCRIDPMQDEKVRLCVAEALGHHRPGISTVYVGTPNKPFCQKQMS